MAAPNSAWAETIASAIAVMSGLVRKPNLGIPFGSGFTPRSNVSLTLHRLSSVFNPCFTRFAIVAIVLAAAIIHGPAVAADLAGVSVYRGLAAVLAVQQPFR